MKNLFLMILLSLLASGCGKSVSRDELEKNKAGYKTAKAFCAQCHKLPFPDQHRAEDWPRVVERMEGNIRAANRRIPNQAEREAILGYFQSK